MFDCINFMGDERLDPEFYQPKFENLEKHLKKIGAEKIDKVCNFVNNGIQPPYFEHGKIAVITQKEMTSTFLELESVKDFTDETFYSENHDFQLKNEMYFCIPLVRILGIAIYYLMK